jgi:hypothetical protein
VVERRVCRRQTCDHREATSPPELSRSSRHGSRITWRRAPRALQAARWNGPRQCVRLSDMTQEPIVVPVVDFEPPIGAPRRMSPLAALRRPSHRRLTAVPPVPSPPAPHAAAIFADTALRGVLEVVDGRRPFAQIRPLLGEGLADTVVGLARTRPNAGLSAAQLRRVGLRIVDRDGDVAEVFATYCRGDRVRAIAGRVECADVRGRRRWRLVALHVG